MANLEMDFKSKIKLQNATKKFKICEIVLKI